MFNFDRILRFFVFAGCQDEDEYQSILPEIHRINRDVFKIVTATLLFLMIALIMITSLFLHSFHYAFNYFLIFAFLLVFTGLVWLIPDKGLKLIQPLLYTFSGFTFFFGILNGVMVPTVNSVGFIITLIVLPLLFIDRPVRVVFISLTAMACFTLAVIMSKPYSIILFDVTNVVIYGFFGIVINNYIVYVKVAKLLGDKKLKLLSQMDLLTGLMNRNSYEQNLPLYPGRSKFSLTCIYMDANGLHELNNTKGHKAGDEMLCTIANLLKERFYPTDIYRIGGDEFVVFVVDDKNGSAFSVMMEITKQLEENDYHVSWGLSSVSAGFIDMTSLIIETEQKMYKAKSAYYLEMGIDRRKARC